MLGKASFRRLRAGGDAFSKKDSGCVGVSKFYPNIPISFLGSHALPNGEVAPLTGSAPWGS